MVDKCFYGLYNLKHENVQGDYTTLLCKISKNKYGKNILTINSVEVNTKNQPDKHYLNETYTISSYDKEATCKIGQITFQALYPNDNNSTTTSPGIQTFAVLGKNGIYKNVQKIKINYKTENRIIYFSEK
jgi:hypothetical protein